MHDSNTDVTLSRQQPRTIRMFMPYSNQGDDSSNIMCLEESSKADFTSHQAQVRLPSNIRKTIGSALIFDLTCDLEDASDFTFREDKVLKNLTKNVMQVHAEYFAVRKNKLLEETTEDRT